MEYNNIYEVRKAWLEEIGGDSTGAENTFEVSKRILDHYQSGPVPPPTPPGIDYDGLIFHANVDGNSISMTNKNGNSPSLEYSLDGINWTTWDYSAISLDKDEEVAFRGTSVNKTSSKYSIFVATGSTNVKGNIMSLVDNGACTATTIPNRYYFADLFQGCSGLVDASELELPATTLKSNSYIGMFFNCTNLTKAPAILPATTLDSQCYYALFKNCSSLISAPVLPATRLDSSCYIDMFYGCSSLNYIKCLATDISGFQSTTDWVKGVSPTGTFVKNASMSDWPSGNSGIPTGWTVVDA